MYNKINSQRGIDESRIPRSHADYPLVEPIFFTRDFSLYHRFVDDIDRLRIYLRVCFNSIFSSGNNTKKKNIGIRFIYIYIHADEKFPQLEAKLEAPSPLLPLNGYSKFSISTS